MKIITQSEVEAMAAAQQAGRAACSSAGPATTTSPAGKFNNLDPKSVTIFICGLRRYISHIIRPFVRPSVQVSVTAF